jgi:hypothetical protein
LQESGKTSSIAGCQNTGHLGLGHNSTYFPGRIAEVLVYRRALSESERQSVEAYLQQKYSNAPPPPQSVATPTITPDGGNYSSPVTVTLQTSTSDATIRYTLNGVTPTSAPQLYTGPFQLNSSATVSARAFKSGLTDSTVASAAFTIESNPPPPPPPGDVPTSGLALWLKGDAGVIANGSTVSQWQDQSGNNAHASQSTNGSRPL